MVKEKNDVITEDRGRHMYIDVLNISACFCVVVLHCTLTVFDFSPRSSWFASLFLQTLAHWAVPIFFMLSGATLLNYRSKYSTKTFFKKRLVRVFAPFILWSILYIIYGNLLGAIQIRNFFDIIYILLNNKAQDIFWFFYALFAIYLSLPVLSLIIKKEHTRTVVYFFCFCLLNASILPLLNRVLNFQIYNLLYFPIANGFIGYIILGWLLHNIQFRKISRIMIYIGGIIGAITMFFGTYFLSARLGQIDTFFMDYQSLDCYLISTAVYVFVKNMRWGLLQDRVKVVIKILSEASFGVYLLQMMIINLISAIFSTNKDSLLYMTLGALIIYILCVVIVTLIKKVPIARKVFP